jgi:hypothetical protein
LRYEGGGIKQEFVVQAGADPSLVRMRWWGLREPEVESRRLRIRTSYGELSEEKLVAYYGTERLGMRYKLVGRGESETGVKFTDFRLEVEGLTERPRATLILDPVLQWGTYFGGTNFEYADMDVDASGNIFIAGGTVSAAFPLSNPGGGAYYDNTYNGGSRDAFIARFMGSNLSLAWCTFYGGSQFDGIYELRVANNGNIFVTGATESSDIPLHNPGGGAFYQTYDQSVDAFVARFSGASLALTWATCIRPTVSKFSDETGEALAIDANGNIFVGVWAKTTDLPLVNPGGGAYHAPYEPINFVDGDVYIARFLGSNLSISWSTYLGGLDADIPLDMVVDASGNLILAGMTNSPGGMYPHNPPSHLPLLNPGGGAYFNSILAGTGASHYEPFMVRFSGTNFALTWCTYFGGEGDERITRLIASPNGNIFIVGYTTSQFSFPFVNPGGGAYFDNSHENPAGSDGFIARFNSALNLTWCTYLPGSVDSDLALGVTTLGATGGNGLVVGMRVGPISLGGPFACPPIQSTYAGGLDGALLIFNSTLALVYATFYGGPALDQIGSVDAYGMFIYAAGYTESPGLPASHLPNPGGGAYHDDTYNGGGDVFILRLDGTNCPPLSYSDFGDSPGRDNQSILSWKTYWDGSMLVIYDVSEEGSFSLYDGAGRTIGRWEVRGSGLRVPLDISPGVYLLQEETTGRSQKLVRLP